MKKILLILIFVFMSVPAYALTSGIQAVVSSGGVPAPGGECTIGSGDNWVNPRNDDYWSVTTSTEDYTGQAVANSGSKNICKITLWVGNYGVPANMILHLKSAWGGDHYGTSDTQSIVDDSGARTKYTFTFSPAVTVPGNFVVEINWAGVEALVGVAYGTGTDDKYFGGTDYKFREDNNVRDNDSAMEIYYEQ